MIRRPGDPIPVPVRRSVPDPAPGRASLYVDQRTRQPVLAVGTERRALSWTEEIPQAGRPAVAAEAGWAGTAAKTITVSSIMGGVVFADVAVPGAAPGMLVTASLTGAIPAEVTGALFGSVTAPGTVRLGVPLSATVGSVLIAVAVAVSPL